ncbi:DUF362 domain-containing protein [Calothrix sp. 336/3]|uniref:DUF362 domain-containing protein n=1 Tax=Calothrix sp. 336/3 TaxID=1337936 RepID=UPI0004E37A66|nr:4Fe-4S binding protein [Calothrix sp. 336/3]AKG24143.1 ferredoxin [Calothrix sp. 336/3]
MAYKITGQCITCNLCDSVCPTDAIKKVNGSPWIDPELCTNCIGSIHTVPQCIAGCPTCDGCVQISTDYWESWFSTYERLVKKLTKKQDYWEKWFSVYSHKFSEQLQKRQQHQATF